MNIVKASLRKQVERERSVLVDLVKDRAYYASGLLLIKDTALNSAKPLLQLIFNTNSSLIVNASDLEAKFDDSINFIIVKDATVELLEENQGSVDNFIKRIWRLVTILSPHKTLVIDLQEDILLSERVASLEYLADTVIKVESSSGKLNRLLEIRHKLPGAKLKREWLKVEAGQLITIESIEPSLEKLASTTPSSTFNLALTVDQAIAKSTVVLPHLRSQMSTLSVTNRPVAGASYRNILAEDYDNEDPDDDLDI